jgi:hypothetical protein
MLIYNERPGLITIPLAPVLRKLKQNEKKEASKFFKNQINLVSGYNDIPNILWKKIKDNFNGINELIKHNYLREIKEEKEENGKKIIKKDFAEFDVEKQEEIIKNTWNVQILQDWKKTEGVGEGTRVLIEDQIKEIKNSKK